MFRKKEDEQKERMDNVLEQYGLTELSEEDLEAVQRIMADLTGKNLMKAGMALSFAKTEEQAKVGYLSALVEQNWIIIRQLDRLNRKLDK
ncbi:hypothetical protein [Sporanaerobacter acetigenes]|uniref:hypothetical protein n=1 Tax=Sporanaerobacter acetigenes TaxID=165813 RepID=UPI0010531D36|nr:hypothetical protein [Sporanaerobacter acetigenes]